MKIVTVQELKQKIDSGESHLLIDVREPHEYEEFNLNGKLIPLGELVDHLGSLMDHKDDQIIVHCRSGKRSAAAVDVMTGAGFSNVANLEGGILQWQEVFPAK